MSHRYPTGTRVRFRSTSDSTKFFAGQIVSYCEKGEYAFIRDDGRAKPRPVAVNRIIGFAMGADVPRVA
jgi:hypothetical protein